MTTIHEILDKYRAASFSEFDKGIKFERKNYSSTASPTAHRGCKEGGNENGADDIDSNNP